MHRTIRAILGYTRNDFLWMLPVLAVLIALCEGLGAIAVVTGDPEDAPLLAMGLLLGFLFLVNTILAIVYLSVQFSLFLSFSSTRRGLVAGILLHCLRLNLLQLAVALLAGTVDALVRRALTGYAPLPWEWIPWPVWPAALLLPPWIGFFLGGLVQRFGVKGFWGAYLVFMLGTTTNSRWLHPAAELFRPLGWQIPAAALLAALAALTALALRWMRRAAVQ